MVGGGSVVVAGMSILGANPPAGHADDSTEGMGLGKRMNSIQASDKGKVI